MNYAFNCKFCGKPGVVTADDAGLELIRPEVWIPRIACSRCSDYMVEKRKVQQTILNACRSVQLARNSHDQTKRAEIEAKLRELLMGLTKRLCGLVCDYHRVTNIWDEQFAMMLVDKPHMAHISIGVYLRGVASLAREAA